MPAFAERMKAAIDRGRGRAFHGRRIATVGSVFAKLRYNERLDRFTLRPRPKVNTQALLPGSQRREAGA